MEQHLVSLKQPEGESNMAAASNPLPELMQKAFLANAGKNYGKCSSNWAKLP